MKYGTMVYLASGKNVLMVKKGVRKDDPNSGYFTLPGGKLETEEKGLDCDKGRLKSVIRETKEETGIELINPVLRGVIFFDNKERKFDNWKNPEDFLVYVYVAKKYKGKAEAIEEDVVPYSVPLEKGSEVPSNPGDKLMYKWLKDGRNFSGVIKHKGNEIDEENCMINFF